MVSAPCATGGEALDQYRRYFPGESSCFVRLFCQVWAQSQTMHDSLCRIPPVRDRHTLEGGDALGAPSTEPTQLIRNGLRAFGSQELLLAVRTLALQCSLRLQGSPCKYFTDQLLFLLPKLGEIFGISSPSSQTVTSTRVFPPLRPGLWRCPARRKG